MDFMIPIVLFVCITYAIKLALDAIVRYRMIKEGVSEQMLESLVAGEQVQRRLSSLRWGIFLVALGAAFALIAAFGWTSVTPGVIALIAFFMGLSQLVYYAITRNRH